MFDLLLYLKVFLVGGFICMFAQILIIKTKMTSARILVMLVVLGVFLEGVGIFDALVQFAESGVTIPILGFGKALAEGAIVGAQENGLLGVFTGGLTQTAGGIACAVGFAYLFAMIFDSRTKKNM